MFYFEMVAYRSTAWRCFYGVQDTLYMMRVALVRYDLLFAASGRNRGIRHHRGSRKHHWMVIIRNKYTQNFVPEQTPHYPMRYFLFWQAGPRFSPGRPLELEMGARAMCFYSSNLTL